MRGTRLTEVMRALGLKPTQLLREAQRLAGAMQRPAISRQHLLRLRHDLATTTADKMYILVAAMRSLTGLHFRASDLFEVEPDAEGGDPVFSVRPISPGWRVFVSQEPGSDADAFESLYTEYGLLLRVIATRRYHIPPDDAEALVHDIFMAYLERRTYIQEVRPWLIGAIKHASSNYLRKRKPEAELLPEHEEAVDTDAEEREERWVRRITVAAILARLGDRCRETLRRYYLGEETKEHIAAHLSTSPGNVLQLLVTCRKRAQELFRSLSGRKE